MLGVDLNKLAGRGKILTRPTKEPLSEKEQNIKIFKAEKKRLDKALKKKLISEDEYEAKLLKISQDTLNKNIALGELVDSVKKDLNVE